MDKRPGSTAIQDLTDSLRRHRRAPPASLPSPDLVAMGINRARATGHPEHSSPAAQQPGPRAVSPGWAGPSASGAVITCGTVCPQARLRAGEDTR